MSGERDGLKAATQRKGSFLQTMGAVAWSFFGVRKASAFENDTKTLNPVHVVIAGVLAALLFVALLAGVVNLVLSSGVAA
jgi:hypothetical protein